MQQLYSSVDWSEVRSGLAKLISLAGGGRTRGEWVMPTGLVVMMVVVIAEKEA